MAVITTSNHPKALWPGVKAWWGRSYDEHEEECSKLFEIEGSTRNYEEDVQLTGFGLAPQKPQGGSVSYADESQGFVSRYTHIPYALGYIVTKEERDDGLYEIVSKRRAQALAFSMRQTKETVAANVYNRAFNGSYAGGDAASLLNASHPNTTGGTWSNTLGTAADLSETSLEDMIIQVMGVENDRGHKISIMPKSLIVPRQEWFNANRILNSVLQYDTANNAANVLKSTNALPDGIKVNHYLTDADAWFIRTNAPRGMVGYQRVKPEFTQDNDFHTDNALAKCYERYIFYWTDPRGLFGSPGA